MKAMETTHTLTNDVAHNTSETHATMFPQSYEKGWRIHILLNLIIYERKLLFKFKENTKLIKNYLQSEYDNNLEATEYTARETLLRKLFFSFTIHYCILYFNLNCFSSES